MIWRRDRGADAFPVGMTILVTDVATFGRLRNPQQVAVREHMYQILSEAFTRSGIPWQSCPHEDRGDGVLVLIPGDVPKAILLARVVQEIVAGVSASDLDGVPPLRLRVAVHAGEVHSDRHGYAGADVNFAFRLVDSEALKRALRSAQARCAVMVSDPFYRATVQHEYEGIRADAYHPVPVRTKEGDATAWLTIPGDDDCARALSAEATGADGVAGTFAGPVHGVQIRAKGNVSIRGGNVAGRDISTSNLPKSQPCTR